MPNLTYMLLWRSQHQPARRNWVLIWININKRKLVWSKYCIIHVIHTLSEKLVLRIFNQISKRDGLTTWYIIFNEKMMFFTKHSCQNSGLFIMAQIFNSHWLLNLSNCPSYYLVNWSLVHICKSYFEAWAAMIYFSTCI